MLMPRHVSLHLQQQQKKEQLIERKTKGINEEMERGTDAERKTEGEKKEQEERTNGVRQDKEEKEKVSETKSDKLQHQWHVNQRSEDYAW